MNNSEVISAIWVTNGLMVLAVLLAPVIAIQVSEYLQRKRENFRRKQWVFHTLMTTRAQNVTEDHVRALNSIDVEFSGKGKDEKQVVEAWKEYLTHLGNNELGDKAPEAWREKRIELFINLLYSISHCIGYDFEKSRLRETSYWPKALVDVEAELNLIRQALLLLLSDEKSLKVTLVPPNVTHAEEMEKAFKGYLKGEVPLQVRILSGEDNKESQEPK
jgi:hypothetical protein